MKYRKKPVVVEAHQWLRNGDHPLDYVAVVSDFGTGLDYSPQRQKEFDWEGQLVRRFRRPDVTGGTECKHCGQLMHYHGWIDTLEGGHIVCPGDYIITGVSGEHYPCKPSIFVATYEAVE